MLSKDVRPRPPPAAAASRPQAGKMAASPGPGRHLPPYLQDASDDKGQCGAGPGTVCAVSTHVHFVCVTACMSESDCRVSSPSPMWIPGTELRASPTAQWSLKSPVSRIQGSVAAELEEREQQLNRLSQTGRDSWPLLSDARCGVQWET